MSESKIEWTDYTFNPWSGCSKISAGGGESGRHARPMHPDWARDLRDQCVDTGVPFFFKQWGEWAPGNDCAGGDLYGLDRSGIKSGMFTYNGDWCGGGPNPFRQTMDRVGKAAAGRILDGQTWDQVPGGDR